VQLQFRNCKLKSSPEHLVFHYNCNHKGASVRWVGAPDREAQAAIDAYYVLSDRHGWEVIEERPAAPLQPIIGVSDTNTSGWRTCHGG
jgi:hypothetical protein